MPTIQRQNYRIVVLEPTKSWIAKNECGGCGKPKKEWQRHTGYKCCSKECTTKMNDNYVLYGAQQIREKVFARDNYTCKNCAYKAEAKTVTEEVYGRTLTHYLSPTNQLDADHIKPIALGGDEWELNNIQTLCKPCHKKKTAKESKLFAIERRISTDQQRLPC